LPNNIVLFFTINKFDPNLVLINMNKLKPYRFIENETLQLVLIKPSDLVIDKPIQAKEPIPLVVKLEDFQLVEFESISNHSTHGRIKSTNMFVQHYHNLLVYDNNVAVSNNPNVFGKAFIDVYLLGVSNPKGCVHS